MSDIIHIKRIDSVSCFDLSPRFATRSEVHDNWEFIYIDSGMVNYTAGETEGTLRQGELLFHRPGEVHRTVCNGKVSASIFTLIFECHSREVEQFDSKVLAVPESLLSLLRSLIDECCRTYVVSKYPLKVRADAPHGGEQLIRNLTESFLILLMRHRFSAPTSVAVREDKDTQDPAGEICRYLKEHLCERVTLDELAEQFHFGKTHMCVMFKKRMGTSIIDHHIDMKVAEAKRLLREETLTVREISERLGFDSPEYFSRCFMRRVGYSPRSFRGMLITDVKVKRD